MPAILYETLTYKNIFFSSVSKLRFFTESFSRCKNLLIYRPGLPIKLIPRAWLIFFCYTFPVCPGPILVVGGLLPRENNCSPVSFPMGEACKNPETGFMR
jgi:hypothetical protein